MGGGYPGAGGPGGKREYMKFLGAGLDGGGKKAFSGGTLAANPLSCGASTPFSTTWRSSRHRKSITKPRGSSGFL